MVNMETILKNHTITVYYCKAIILKFKEKGNFNMKTLCFTPNPMCNIICVSTFPHIHSRRHLFSHCFLSFVMCIYCVLLRRYCQSDCNAYYYYFQSRASMSLQWSCTCQKCSKLQTDGDRTMLFLEWLEGRWVRFDGAVKVVVTFLAVD